LQIKTIDFDLQGISNLARQHIQAAWLDRPSRCNACSCVMSRILCACWFRTCPPVPHLPAGSAPE
jgi:hypothetical protein